MPDRFLAIRPYSEQEFLSTRNIALADEAVAEVFHVMLNLPTRIIPTTPRPNDVKERTAIIGFSGLMRGSCEVRMTAAAAAAITTAMMGGIAVREEDEEIGDAVGEICNMIAGGWKNRIPALSSQCSISPPTVITGINYTIQMGIPSVKLTRTYRFDVHTFQLTLRCEEAMIA